MTITPANTPASGGDDLWCMHIQGPDDLHAAPDFWTALAWAAELNTFIAEKAIKGNWAADDNYPLSQATVRRWIGTRESHAVHVQIELADRAEHEAKRKEAAALAAPTPQADGGVVPEMLAALKAVNAIIAEAAMTGFNCHDGDWAERLFLSQQATSRAIKFAAAPPLNTGSAVGGGENNRKEVMSNARREETLGDRPYVTSPGSECDASRGAPAEAGEDVASTIAEGFQALGPLNWTLSDAARKEIADIDRAAIVSPGSKIIAGMKDAVAFAQGDISRGRIVHPAPAEAGDDLAGLSARATPGEWAPEQSGGVIRALRNGQSKHVAFASHEDTLFIVALVNAYRSGRISPASRPAEQGEPVAAIDDAARFRWLEEQARKSTTGISFDWVPSVEGEPSGFRFMRRFFVGGQCKTLRAAIDRAMKDAPQHKSDRAIAPEVCNSAEPGGSTEDELVEIIAAQMWLDSFGPDIRRDWQACVREAEEYGPESAAAMQVYQRRMRARRFADAIRPWLAQAAAEHPSDERAAEIIRKAAARIEELDADAAPAASRIGVAEEDIRSSVRAALVECGFGNEPIEGAVRHTTRAIIALLASSAAVGSGTQAARDVLAERRRQVEAEGWTPEHDDAHGHGEMATAAACYAYMSPLDDNARKRIAGEGAPYRWPWHPSRWKPADPRRDLVKAGALILAEIERFDRRTANAEQVARQGGRDGRPD